MSHRLTEIFWVDLGATMSQQPDTAKPLVLVTGASGYIASHIVQQVALLTFLIFWHTQLLQAGYLVRGTVRDTTNEAKVKHLKDLEGSERLELVNADLLEDGSFDTAMQGIGSWKLRLSCWWLVRCGVRYAHCVTILNWQYQKPGGAAYSTCRSGYWKCSKVHC